MNTITTRLDQESGWSVNAHRRSKQPATPAAGSYGHPFHPIVVALPIGAWVAALVFDVIALFSRDPEPFALGATVLVGIGLVGALLAAVFGLLDLSRLARGTPARRIGLTHMGLNLGVVAVFGVSSVSRYPAGLCPSRVTAAGRAAPARSTGCGRRTRSSKSAT